MRFGPNFTSRTKFGPYCLYLGQNVKNWIPTVHNLNFLWNMTRDTQQSHTWGLVQNLLQGQNLDRVASISDKMSQNWFQLSTTSIFYETWLGIPSNPIHEVWSKIDVKDKIGTVWPLFGTKCPKLDSNCPQPQFFMKMTRDTQQSHTWGLVQNWLQGQNLDRMASIWDKMSPKLIPTVHNLNFLWIMTRDTQQSHAWGLVQNWRQGQNWDRMASIWDKMSQTRFQLSTTSIFYQTWLEDTQQSHAWGLVQIWLHGKIWDHMPPIREKMS